MSILPSKKSLRDKLFSFLKKEKIQISNEQMQMILDIINLKNFDADSIKIPFNKIVSLPINATLADIESLVRKSGHSRIPVYEEKDGKKEYVGILHVKDLIPVLFHKIKKFKLTEHIRKIKVAPESQKLLSLMREMRMNRTHLVLTVNEYGDISGLVTLEDIMEEIVGDIKDEYDDDKNPIKEIGLRQYLVDASINLTDLNDHLALNLPEEKFNTLAGYLLHEFKGEPVKDKKIKYGNIFLSVDKYKGQTIDRAVIQIENDSPEEN